MVRESNGGYAESFLKQKNTIYHNYGIDWFLLRFIY